MTKRMPPVSIDGSYTRQENGYKCDWCGDTIEIDEHAMTVQYATVEDNDHGDQRAIDGQYGAIIHRSCLR